MGKEQEGSRNHRSSLNLLNVCMRWISPPLCSDLCDSCCSSVLSPCYTPMACWTLSRPPPLFSSFLPIFQSERRVVKKHTAACEILAKLTKWATNCPQTEPIVGTYWPLRTIDRSSHKIGCGPDLPTYFICPSCIFFLHNNYAIMLQHYIVQLFFSLLYLLYLCMIWLYDLTGQHTRCVYCISVDMTSNNPIPIHFGEQLTQR